MIVTPGSFLWQGWGMEYFTLLGWYVIVQPGGPTKGPTQLPQTLTVPW